MTRGTRIVAIDAGEPQGAPASDTAPEQAEPAAAEEAEIEALDEAPPGRSWFTLLAFVATMALVGGWTGLFVFVNRQAMQAGADLAQWTGWLSQWSLPVLLVAVLWLLAMRNSRREAARFAASAQALSAESARLELRLTTVNRELSLAREFIAAQSRDLEALGRVAAERLSEHAGRLASLIADNGNRLDSIQSVSAAALDNMESLRGHLPVIASSAKDVTNNIGNAGRTAQAQVDELISGFARLNEFGQASERQVNALRAVVDETLVEFTRQTEHLGEITEHRFAELAARGAEFRTQLEAQEIEALAAIRSRADSLADELDQARQILDVQESDSLTSLRARLTAVRDESAAVVRALRDGESQAIEAWKIAIVQLEDDLSGAIARIAQVDEQAMATARNRLAELNREAAEVEQRLNERDQHFLAEVESRRAAFEERHAGFVAALGAQLDSLDRQIAERQASQEQQGERLVAQSETVAAQLDQLVRQIDEVATLGTVAQDRVAESLLTLRDNLAASREALNGTDSAIAGLTDGSVRLLELIRASVQHSTEDLPEAMGISEARLSELSTALAQLKERLAEAEDRGALVAGHISRGAGELDLALGRIEQLSAKVTDESTTQASTLAAMAQALDQLRSDSLAIAEQAQGELKTAIDALDQSAREAVAGISSGSAAAVAELAARIGSESAAAIDQAIDSRVRDISAQLERAAADAAGVSREAAIQLRDQLARVSELTGHLEQRVAHARARAEEQVDNDFARRVALITESLNSNAIDIARAMDTEVTDTAWSAYLRGDRGIFTRRAVRLLTTGEARAIAQFYEGDRVFHDHVSRYIHDFEAMLRQVLSTRDGHALGVTLLSSDMGKLYVALAQAIERLRS